MKVRCLLWHKATGRLVAFAGAIGGIADMGGAAESVENDQLRHCKQWLPELILTKCYTVM